MDNKIEVKTLEPTPILSIRMRTSLDKLPEMIGKNYMQIFNYLNELGEQPIGAPFTAYFNQDMQDLDVEMGFPVARLLPGKDEIQSGEIHAGRVVSCLYKGPYSGMEPVYAEMNRWMADKGLEPTGAAYEYYYNSPGEVAESDLLTRIDLPIK